MGIFKFKGTDTVPDLKEIIPHRVCGWIQGQPRTSQVHSATRECAPVRESQ